MIEVGDRLELTIGAVAHGGHCVARHDGQVVFVRHTLPGERVVAVITDVGGGRRFLRADAVQILEPSADRREPPCPHSGPGGCGGCDWQHVRPAAQRELKESVVTEAMRRIARTDVAVAVEPVPGDDDGLAWRTRATFSVDADGRAGFRRHRSHTIVPVDLCPLVTDDVASVGVGAMRCPAGSQVAVAATSTGERAVAVRPLPTEPQVRAALLEGIPGDVAVVGARGSARLHERVGDIDYVVPAEGFWQVHPGAPRALVDAVVAGLNPRAGEHVVDLYAGAGLFGVALSAILGPGGRVDLVESDTASCSAARRTVHSTPSIRVHESSVDAWLARSAPRRCDLVVLDPPESGAGKAVLERAVRMRPRALAYVSCDPASLARDVAALAACGWQLSTLRAFDIFPTTHHVECVAVFKPVS